MGSLNYEIDQILNPNNEHPRESKNPADRELYEGMIFTKITDKGIDTFEILAIDDISGKITLWDGWGSKKISPKNKSAKEMSFTDFSRTIQSLKKNSKDLYRLSAGKKHFGIKEFNQFCVTPDQYEDGKDG